MTEVEAKEKTCWLTKIGIANYTGYNFKSRKKCEGLDCIAGECFTELKNDKTTIFFRCSALPEKRKILRRGGHII